MEEFIKGDVVVISFPFSDFTKSKRRPLKTLLTLKFRNVIPVNTQCVVCRDLIEKRLFLVEIPAFAGMTAMFSEIAIRVSKLFTVSNELIREKAGNLKKELMDKVISRTIDFIKK
jgi:hypothetical protein